MQPSEVIVQIKNIQEALEEIRDELGDPSADQVIAAETAIILALNALDYAIGELEEMDQSKDVRSGE